MGERQEKLTLENFDPDAYADQLREQGYREDVIPDKVAKKKEELENARKIEIDIESLIKQEKHYEYVTVHPKKGKPFKRKQLVGRKEEEKSQKETETKSNIAELSKKMDSYIDDLSLSGKSDQVDAIATYTAGDYTDINYYLRHDELPPDSEYDEEGMNKLVDDAQEFLYGAPKYKGVVYRGIGFNSGRDYDNFMAKAEEGNVIEFSEFLSTSITYETVSNFMRGSAGSVMLEIKSGNGVFLGSASSVPGEKEVMFPYGMTLKVVNVDTSSGQPLIQLED